MLNSSASPNNKRPEPIMPDFEGVKPLLKHGCVLIRLHKWTDWDPKKDESMAKRPLEDGWRTRKPLTVAAAKKHMESGGNLGVRPRPEDFIIDVDPRNGGLESLTKLEQLTGTNFRANYPCVNTSSGGTHIYTSKPADVKISNHHPDFPGLDFNPVQVVAPGSVHPDYPNGPHYDWDDYSPCLPAKPAPQALIDLITKKPKAPTEAGSGEPEWTPEMAEKALKQLDVTQFRVHDDWFQLMCALHEATGGLGEDVFVAWSTSDDLYAGHESIIRERWGSLEAGKTGNAGVGTLIKILLDHGVTDIPRNPAADFEGMENEASDESSKPWPTPEPIQGTLPPVEPFKIDLLPKSLRRRALDIAERMRVPLDFAAVALVCCLAGAVNRRARIQPKAKDDTWQVVPNLWGSIIAPPGFMKTPVMNAVMHPLEKIQGEWFSQYQDKMKFYTAAEEDHGKKKKDSEQTPLPEKPKLQRLIVNDSTVEKLHETLSENPAGIFYTRDELTGWLSEFEKPGHESDRAFFLSAWAGDTAHISDRIKRGTTYVEACCISMLGGIQPGRLRSYFVDAVRGGSGDDGLIQRFQVMIWPDPRPDYEYVDRPPDKEAAELVEGIFRELVKLDPAKPARYRFASDAQELFVKWLRALEAKAREGDDHAGLISHLNKYRSLMPSLALLFDLVDRAEAGMNTEGDMLVSLEHTQQAVSWCEYLESHARRVYSCLVRPEVGAAAELADKITGGKIARDRFFTYREVQRKGWSRLDTLDAVRRAVKVMEDAGWVRSAGKAPGAMGGRPPERYEVNPGALVLDLI